jgi:hypothetical protein
MGIYRRLKALAILPFMAIFALVPAPRRLFYQGGANGAPTRFGRTINRWWAIVAGAGFTPYSWPGRPRGGTVALETIGRRSGKPRENVITWVEYEGQRYFVSMLSDRVDWVRNVRAADGKATILHGRRHPVRLEEVPVEQRAPILRDYLKRTRMSTQEHLASLAPDAPLEQYARIADQHPVFRIVEVHGSSRDM